MNNDVVQSATDLEAALRDIVTMARNAETKGLLEKVRAVVASPAFDKLPENERYFGLSVFGAALYEAGDSKSAYPILVRASEMPEATGQIWLLRLYTTPNSDQAQNLLCIATIAERWPGAMDKVKETYINRLIFKTAEAPELRDVRFRAMQALKAANWPGDGDVTFAPDWVWLALVREDLDRGSVHEATAAAELITDPAALIELRVDRRYDPARAGIKGNSDVGPVQEAYLARLKAFAAANPDNLKVVNHLALELLAQNQPERALALVDDALSKAQSNTKPAQYSDADENLHWTLDSRGRILMVLGRYDEALATMQRASQLTENDGRNVSQKINLGDFYDDLGRPRDALNALADVEAGEPSKFGSMQAWSVRACAYAQLHDDAHYAEQRKLMQEHMADAPAALQDALVCSGDLDGAAKIMIQRLADPKMRIDALKSCQHYILPPHELAAVTAIRKKEEILMARPDVKAAIEAVGRIEAQPRLMTDY